MAESSKPLPPRVAVGECVDAFQIVEQIGATGTSIVWRAHDGLMDRDVAVKQLLAGPSEDDTLLRRWSNEVAVMKKAADGGEHLVQIIDWIEEPRGCFIVMEFVDGPSLHGLLAKLGTALDIRQAIGILGATAMALKTLHARGAVHRDLKPSNILLPRGGGLKVCDFGLAALQAGQEAMTAGTVRYMAPELFGDGKADARSDLYSLGMIAYEILVGKDGFEKAFHSVLRDPRTEALRWMKWHTNPRQQPMPMPSLNPAVPARLDELVQRMLEKDPHRRVASADACVQAIRRHFAPGQSPPPEQHTVAVEVPAGDDRPTASLPRRRRLPYVLVAVLAVQVLAAVGIFAVFRHQDHARKQAVLAAFREDLRAAVEMIEAQQYAEARTALVQVQAEGPAAPQLMDPATAYMQFCDAMLAWQAGEHADALKILDALDMRGLLPDRDALMETRDRVVHDMGFAALTDEIEAMMEEGRFVDAIAQIDRDTTRKLSSEERQQLQQLRDQIQQRRTLRQLDDIEQEVEFDLSRADHAAALNLITRIRERGGPDMPQLKKLEQRVRADQTFVRLRLEAETKWRVGTTSSSVQDLVAAIKLLEDAGKMQGVAGTDADHSRIRETLPQWRGTVAFQRGMTAEQAGRLAEAREHFIHAKAASLPQADAAAHRIDARMAQAKKVTEARLAMQQRRYAEAVELFRSATTLWKAPAVQRMLDEATVSLYLETARSFERDDDVDAARGQYEQVLEIEPNHAQAREGIDRVAVQANYLDQVAAGDSLFDRDRFGEAKRRYLQARKIMATRQIEEKLDATEFEDLMLKAKAAYTREDYREARALLRAAADTSTGQEQRGRIETLAETLNSAAPEQDAETSEVSDE